MALDASAGETAEAVAEFAKQHKLTLPIALDARGATADIFGARVTTTCSMEAFLERMIRQCGLWQGPLHTLTQSPRPAAPLSASRRRQAT